MENTENLQEITLPEMNNRHFMVIEKKENELIIEEPKQDGSEGPKFLYINPTADFNTMKTNDSFFVIQSEKPFNDEPQDPRNYLAIQTT